MEVSTMSSIYSFQDRNIMNYFNQQPSTVKSVTSQVEQYKRYLYTKLYSVYKFNIPEEWAMNYFRFQLFHWGSLAVIYTDEFGWIPQPYSILELDLFYQPKKIQVYNQFIKDPKVGIIGINSGIIRLMDDFYGLDDIVTKYAVQLAEIDKACHINLMTTNTAVKFDAKDKKEADEIKEAFGRASEGEPFIVVKKSITDQQKDMGTTLLPNPTALYLTDKLLDARATVMKQFLTEIGIANANTQKKERLISDEVNQNNQETNAVVDIIKENLDKCFKEINSISGLNLSVEKRYEEVDNEIYSMGSERVSADIQRDKSSDRNK